MIFPVATVIREEAGAPFHVTVFPHIKEMARFQPKTALGKLKAEIIPTVPSGFQTYIMKCYFLYELKTEPLNKQLFTQ